MCVANSSNPARLHAFQAFRDTLNTVHGRKGVTEASFADLWGARLREIPCLSADGWYQPPPEGMAVLADSEPEFRRIRFGSLRDQVNWPSTREIDWDNGMLYAYCSPVHIESGIPGDFAVTLYFGRREAVRSHFAHAYRATKRVLELVTPEISSVELFKLSEEVFAEARLKNSVISVTDTSPLDLGHSLPRVDSAALKSGRELSADVRNQVRLGRQFISRSSPWTLASANQVTVEPQLICLEDESLPQISFHYVVVTQNRTHLNECDRIFQDLGLI
jgi:hypothetical protein